MTRWVLGWLVSLALTPLWAAPEAARVRFIEPIQATAPLSPVTAVTGAHAVEAAALAEKFSAELPLARSQIENLFYGIGEVTARAKTEDSVAAKLVMGKDVRDGVGTRLTIDDATPEGMEVFVERMGGAFKRGELKATSLSNFQGTGEHPYLTKEQLARLKEAAGDVWVRKEEKSFVPAGYAAIHFNLKFANGAVGELQIRGRHVHELAELEHDVYDARRGKGSRGLGAPVSELTEKEKADHLTYLAAHYLRARRAELYGVKAAGPVPPLPPSLADRPELRLTPRR